MVTFKPPVPPTVGKGQPNPGGPTGSASTGGQQMQAAGSGNDWQHLLLRGGEFILGAILIYVGVAGLVARTRPAKMAINVVAGGVAGGASQAVRQRTRASMAARSS